MDSGQASDDLLAHFDRPKLLNLPDFEWVNEVASCDSATIAIPSIDPPSRATERYVEVPRDIRRGVGWVLAWAGALGVLAIAVGLLTEFAYLLAAERALSIAARTGAMEATLPRATYQSIEEAVGRRLNHYPRLAGQLHLSLLQNGTLVESQFRRHDGDDFGIILSAPSSAVLPNWLRTFTFWYGDSPVRVYAQRRMPGRKLRLVSQ